MVVPNCSILDSLTIKSEQTIGNREFLNDSIPIIKIARKHHTYNVADISDSAVIYKNQVCRKNCFVVVSKREYRMYIYESIETPSPLYRSDTMLVASFPICYALNQGKKMCEGDGKTPESTLENPCKVSEILDSSKWKHDFQDGRGNILSYGPYFLRLKLPDLSNESIGIHGTTNNEESVPGRDSEGCIRMRNADLIEYKKHFAFVGQLVIIKSNSERKYPFEVRAQEALGQNYVHPIHGNPLKETCSFVGN